MVFKGFVRIPPSAICFLLFILLYLSGIFSPTPPPLLPVPFLYSSSFCSSPLFFLLLFLFLILPSPVLLPYSSSPSSLSSLSNSSLPLKS